MKNKNIVRPAFITTLALLIPLVAMQFTPEVNWTFYDFVFAGALIFGTGFLYELIAGKGGNKAYRAAVAVALGTVFLLIWINGAVGIIGNENNPANLLYFGVFAVLFLGSIVARLKSQAMVRVMFVTGFVQILVPVVAFIVWKPDFNSGVVQVFFLNAVFAVLWFGSALLFRNAGFIDFQTNR
jgi:hypothetical protein